MVIFTKIRMSLIYATTSVVRKFVSSVCVTCTVFLIIISSLSIQSKRNGNRDIVDHLHLMSYAAAAPSSAPSLRQVALQQVGDITQLGNLSRLHSGDVFDSYDVSKCNTDTCVGLSSGTAYLFTTDIKEIDMSVKYKAKTEECKCQCLPHLSTYREDLGICVDDIHECSLAPFVSGSSSEKIPFVFLPLRGQIVHPSKEISFSGVKTPICAVSGSQFLSSKGWSELRNPIDTDVPFQLFRDEGRTFLQWLGETDMRHKMQGRLILVHLMCRDVTLNVSQENVSSEDSLSSEAFKSQIQPKIFTPCVAFRVAGTPVKYINNVTEVSFQSETLSESTQATPAGLSTREYVVIGICSLLLGLIYVASVFLYLHVKKRKSRPNPDAPSSGVKNDLTYATNDQVTYATGLGHVGSVSNYGSSNHINLPVQRQPSGQRKISTANLNVEECGIIKTNPLLKHYSILSDNSGFISDMSNSNSECDDERIGGVETNNPARQHISTPQFEHNRLQESGSNAGQETECLPEEDVSIVDDLTTDDKLENMKALVNGTMRRKLYFNPAYFEPQLLVSPPPAAIEFLTKIREVIAIAKYKMATKRYQPSLIMIPEESQAANCTESNATQGRRASTVSLKCKNACVGCPGCDKIKSAERGEGCKNCGDKRNSIHKWLEGISPHDIQPNINDNAESIDYLKEKDVKKTTSDSSSISESDTVKASSVNSNGSTSKRKAPPIPTSAPKIVSLQEKMMKQKEQSSGMMEVAATNNIVREIDRDVIYKELAKAGSEIYNNPQFQHGSPHLSMRTKIDKITQKDRRPEVLDQYANPKVSQRHYEVLRNLHQMPDMVYEAMAVDYTKRSISNKTGVYGSVNLPSPDYDETYKTKRFDSVGDPFVPSPDYNTYGRTKQKQYQPDSPIYTRKSPHFLIVDYETDSLERSVSHKTRRDSDSPPSNGSDASSQPSPSLSTALPLEEEVEIRHTVYDRVEGFRKDGEPPPKANKIVKERRLFEDARQSQCRSNNSFFYAKQSNEPRIMYNTPYHGSMTIEVEHNPTEYEISTDSDQFEPDTLDRKPKRQASLNNNQMNIKNNKIRAWTQHMQKSSDFLNHMNENIRYSSLENMSSLPDLQSASNQQLILKSTGSFKSTSLSNSSELGHLVNGSSLQRNFGSLREIYEAKNIKNLQRPSLNSIDFMDVGRILTLEARHSKRQRQTNQDTIKKIMPPDVIPFDSNNNSSNTLYDSLKSVVTQKNLTGWNTADKRHPVSTQSPQSHNKQEYNDDNETIETRSSNSESTEITGVSDTQINSELQSDSTVMARHIRKRVIEPIFKFQQQPVARHSQRPSSMGDETESIGILESFMNLGDIKNKNFFQTDKDDFSDSSTNKSMSTKFDYKQNTDKIDKNRVISPYTFDDIDKIEVISSTLNSTDSQKRSLIKDLVSDRSNFTPTTEPTKVFHVEVSHVSNGMQIALGLRDRAKKTKDIKNAWRKFITMATIKFQGAKGKNDLHSLEKSLRFSDPLDREDEGISSMNDDRSSYDEGRNCRGSYGYVSRPSSSNRSDMDSGYLSADSSEIYGRKSYERFNFKDQQTEPCISMESTRNNFKNIQVIKEISETESIKSSDIRKNTHCVQPLSNDSCTTIIDVEYPNAISVSVYSSEDDRHSSGTETDEELDELSESGAESVETHSVFFKNVRKAN